MAKTSVFTMLAAGFQENSLFHFKPPEALFSLLRVAAPLPLFLLIFSKYILGGQKSVGGVRFKFPDLDKYRVSRSPDLFHKICHTIVN